MCAQRSERVSAVKITGPDPRLAFIEPMVPSLVDKPRKGDQWFHEIKYDGYRSQIAIAGREVRVYTRNGYDWTKKYRHIADAALELIGRDARIDGEIIVQDAAGKPDFHSLRGSITSSGHRLVFYAFDLLSLDGEDLRRRPCEERRAMLETLLAAPRPADPIHFSQTFEGSGEDFFAAVDKLGLEGMVSKRRSSFYSAPARAEEEGRDLGQARPEGQGPPPARRGDPKTRDNSDEMSRWISRDGQIVDAFRWTGGIGQTEEPFWMPLALRQGKARIVNKGTPDASMNITSESGIEIEAFLGDWIVRDDRGEIPANRSFST